MSPVSSSCREDKTKLRLDGSNTERASAFKGFVKRTRTPPVRLTVSYQYSISFCGHLVATCGRLFSCAVKVALNYGNP